MQAEIDRQGDIDAVDDRLQQQAEGSLAAPENEAEDGIVGERCRPGENADGEIGCGGIGDSVFRPHQRQPGPQQKRRKGKQCRAAAERQDQRPPEDRLLLAAVPPSEGLRRQAGGRGTQKIEAAEDQIEEHGADGEPGQRFRHTHMADHGGVSQAEQRRRHETECHRNGDRQHHPVRHVEGQRIAAGLSFGAGIHRSASLAPDRIASA